MATPWDRLVIPNFDAIVGVMYPMYFLDKLLAKKLINRPEFVALKSKTPPDQVRYLLVEILPTRPATAYDVFRDVLRETEEQRHLVEKFFPDDVPDIAQGPAPLAQLPAATTSASSVTTSTTSTSSASPSVDRECTSNDIRLIYRNMSSYWHKIGVELGLPLYELEKIMKEEGRDNDEQCYKMLNIWINRNFGRATVFALLDAIRIVQCPLDAIFSSRIDPQIIEGWKVHLANRS